jgi:hypothetical protein
MLLLYQRTMLILQHEDEEIAGDALYKSQQHWIKQ